MSGTPNILRRWPALLFALVGAVWPAGTPTAAATPQDDVAEAGASVGRALDAARSGDLSAARREYLSFENRWFDIEEGVHDDSPDAYRTIEKAMSGVRLALADAGPSAVVDALVALDGEQRSFSGSQARPPSGTGAPAVGSGSDGRPVALALPAIALAAAAVVLRLRRRRRTGTIDKETSSS